MEMYGVMEIKYGVMETKYGVMEITDPGAHWPSKWMVQSSAW
jgi:hypothetical protein